MSLIEAGQTSTTYTISTDLIKQMIANDLDVDIEKLSVRFVIGDVGLGDPMDRYPAPRGLTHIEATVTG